MKVSAYNSSESLCNWIFEYADFGIILTDAELRITDVNRWIRHHSGKHEIMFRGSYLMEMFPEVKERGFEHSLRDALSGASVILSSTFHKYFLKFPDNSGSGNDLMRQTVKITPLLNHDAVYGLLIHIEDVTERIGREDLLQRKNEELQKLNSTKDRFFSIISHDLRSPFTTLLGLSELLRDDEGVTGEKARSMVSMLHTALKNQYQFLENLLEWSRLQTKKHEFVYAEIRLNDIISHVIKMSLPQAKSKNILITALCNPEEISLLTDSQALTSVIYNLVFNALKFTNPGGKVEIRAAQTEKATVISVKDNGLGIPEEQLNKLFRIDEAISTAGTENEKGTGIGLILVKEIVDKLKGTVSVESEPGKGSIFFVTLPRDW